MAQTIDQLEDAATLTLESMIKALESFGKLGIVSDGRAMALHEVTALAAAHEVLRREISRLSAKGALP